MTRCALVHPSTSKLGPDDQAKGVYEYTPPLVLAYLRGEPLASNDLVQVHAFYASKGLPMPSLDPEPALAGLTDAVHGRWEVTSPQVQQIPRKVVRKALSEETPPRKPLEEIVAVAVSCYTSLQKEELFNQLAAELGYSVE